jgi:signal recognition particle subunit SRP54
MFDYLSQKFSSVYDTLTGAHKLTEKNIDQALVKVHEALLEADVPYDVVKDFTSHIKEQALNTKLQRSLKPAEHLMKILHDNVLEFLGGKASSMDFAFTIPSVVMVMGLQGAGKTTTIAKLVSYVQKQAQKKGKKRRIGVGSVDFYRPAAVDQLKVLSERVDAHFIESSYKDPVSAAQDIADQAKKNHIDILFLDTAGRLHVDNDMLYELQQIDTHVRPKYKFLVVDAMTGQESLNVARAFDENVGFTGSIITKMDSEARGGLAFAFRYKIKKPILFVATGEKTDDLEPFRAERMTTRIIGMGDVKSLVEKAEEKIKKSEQQELYKSFSKGKITLQDFASHMDMVSRLGSLSHVLKFLPGASSMGISPDMIEKGEGEMKKFKAIISSMTPKERCNAQILDPSRKKRVAQGSGLSVADVNALLTRFEQSQQFLKHFKKMGKFKV